MVIRKKLDTITQEYKYNQGTGAFAKGKRIGFVLNGVAYHNNGTPII